MTVTQIDDITMLEQPRRWRRLNVIVLAAKAPRRQLAEHAERRVAIGERFMRGRCRQGCGLQRVAGAARKQVVAADMVEMRVAGQRHDALGLQPWQLRQQINNSETAVDQQVVLATSNVPDIAAIKRIDVLLEDVSDSIAHALVTVPVG